MFTSATPLLNLTASDVMTSEIVVLPEEMSLRCAAHILNHGRCSGAPVVDQDGRCVGVLSAADFVRWIEHDGVREHTTLSHSESVHGSWEIVDVERLPLEEVRDYMTPDPVTIDRATTVGEMARLMVDAHIHRIIVVGPQLNPIGIVSSTDLLAVLARANQVAHVEPAASADHGISHSLRCSS